MVQTLAATAFVGSAEKESVVVDYYLTTILSVTEKTAMNYCAATVHSCFTYRHILYVIHENLSKYARFVYDRITPTLKGAGSNSVGHTKQNFRR